MNQEQIEVLQVVSEVLSHIRQRFDTMIEDYDAHFAMLSALESGESMIKDKIQAVEELDNGGES